MSGKPWTPERKAAVSKRSKARWNNRFYRRKQSAKLSAAAIAAMADPERRTASSARMTALNERMRTDPALKRKCVKGQKRARRKKPYRARRSAAMRKTMARPELRETARQHAIAINHDPAVRKRQWDGRRRKAVAAAKPAAPQAPPRPHITADPNTIFLQLLAREARKGVAT